MAVERIEGRRAVFIDKDGTLIHDVPYNVDPKNVRLTMGAGRALWRMKNAGYQLIVISNQSGVARGLFEEKHLLPVNRRIQTLLAPYGVKIDAFYYCPHGPDDDCECRKPMPGMILRAARDHGFDPQISWMIGDILNDVEAGNRAGCRTIHIDNGNETEWIRSAYRQPLYTVRDLTEAADIICHEAGTSVSACAVRPDAVFHC
ncbi:D,D-heptose 1,7-bisphosphate phosphatase [Nitrosospira briensis]|uniref:D,D-heptose 1,7-bisphosphate phosphatase n=1 Tax=Nitrosospira briensis TaxID=35799 RepID=A0A1I5BXS7_9PROT|nr:HAD family hydrolase [Nitrosospira briensis]SFN79484.1 D,D-heptose 1,7-bisphosphate phosphatase [Nitrosospira briensis]